MDLDQLSSVAQDYLKVIWSAGEWGEPPITTTGLATRFSTTAANVSATLRRLEAQGLVDYRPYRPATLTPLGQRLAIAMVRRHRLLETFLAQTLGYAWDEVHDEAERLEHAVSEVFLARIDALLGHPLVDPHGDPIPSLDGTLDPMAATADLAEVAPGSYVVARVADTDSQLLAGLAGAGLRPGIEVRMGAEGGAWRVAGSSASLGAVQPGVIRVYLVG